MPSITSDTDASELAILRHGERIAAALPRRSHAPKAIVERRVMGAMMDDEELRAAVFRFVDVRPACRTRADLADHLAELLDAAQGSRLAGLGAGLAGRSPTRTATAAVAAAGVRQMAHRFIIGADATAALPGIGALWDGGASATVDLLGETTVTEAEAESYARRCESTLRALDGAARSWPARPRLEHDAGGAIPRVNLSVKVSALTPAIRAHAPHRGVRGAEERLRRLLRVARDVGAHVHVDMESLDTRESITDLLLALLSEDEFADGPSAGIVLQAYLTESPAHLDRLLDWVGRVPRTVPFTVRLVKGAYWDHEVIQATQHGWPVPVFQDRRACDRNFETLTRRLVDASTSGRVRAAIASHNLRSIAHAVSYAERRSADIELQVLRGLGDDTMRALVRTGHRVRCYCPVGDLVAGMAYLVRRLLENTSNDSFLGAQAKGADTHTLLETP
ncbi:proline dehydrogenase family protein [Patulibacter sp. NPDC049589]|uniref:proline dehydrogenase family protein n=1 Tax=Patulibacter sp. NPDC049589 TaxID=3154731 RepID=UPI00342029E2